MRYKRRGTLSGSLRLAIPLFFVILLLAIPLQSQDRLPQVNITISSKNRSINQVLDEITLQSGYYFTYNAALISGSKKVRFNVSDLPLHVALDSLLGDDRFAYRIIQRNIVIYQKNVNPPAPIIEEIDRSFIKGEILDTRTGKPLPYATLALFGTSLGSITNQNGEFSFKIPGDLPDPMVVVSYMGYKSMFIPVTYPIEDELVIRLEKETIPLQEVIIRFADPAILLTDGGVRFIVRSTEHSKIVSASIGTTSSSGGAGLGIRDVQVGRLPIPDEWVNSELSDIWDAVLGDPQADSGFAGAGGMSGEELGRLRRTLIMALADGSPVESTALSIGGRKVRLAGIEIQAGRITLHVEPDK